MSKVNLFGWVVCFLGLLTLPAWSAPNIVISSPKAGRIDTAYLRVEGSQQGVTVPMWYEVRLNGNKGRLVDFGAFPNKPNWFFIARHLAKGTNYIQVFGQAADGQRSTAQVAVSITPDETSVVNPRPNPAEVWWGGHGANEQLTDPARPWEYVKKYADGYFFHSGYWIDDRIETIGRSINEQLAPYGTRFMIELGGQQAVMVNEETARNQFTGWGAPGILGSYLKKAGICFSEITHDYGIDFEPAARYYLSKVNGKAKEAEILRFGVDKLWGELYFKPNFEMEPWLKGAVGCNGAWRWFENYPWCQSDEYDFTTTKGVGRTDGVYVPVDTTRSTFSPKSDKPFLVNGKTVDLRFNLKDVQERFIQTFKKLPGHETFSFYSDCPYLHMTLLGEKSPTAVRARIKLRAVESYLHSEGARHTLICNEEAPPTTDNLLAEHKRWFEDSFGSMVLHQREGGRADRYLFESWYFMNLKGAENEKPISFPHWVAPEDQDWTYTNLAKRAVKYIKGIGSDGKPMKLELNMERLGAVAVLTLTNKSDTECMPALVAREENGKAAKCIWRDDLARDISREIRSDEGWVYASMLKPGEALTVSCEWKPAYGKPITSVPRVVVEAFWNPQDPTGVVRDRAIWSFDSK